MTSTSLGRRLPLNRISFAALQKTYEEEYYRAVLLYRLENPRETGRDNATNGETRGLPSVVASAAATAQQIGELWKELGRLYRRLTEIEANPTSKGFTEEEKQRLLFFGFEVQEKPEEKDVKWPTSGAATTGDTQLPPQSGEAYRQQVSQLRQEASVLRVENEQLRGEVVRLRWVLEKTRRGGSTSRSVTSATAPEGEAPSVTPGILDSLLGASTSCSAVDIAIADELQALPLPEGVTVERLGPDGLYRIDKPIFIYFEPGSSKLVVETLSPEEGGVMPLHCYLAALHTERARMSS